MKTSTSTLLSVIVTIGALGGCEWIAGIENTTIGVDAMRPADAAQTADASMTTRPDGGGDSPDAAQGCPGACINDDSFADFDGQQGGANGRWHYVEVLADGYAEMTPFTSQMGFWGFIGTGEPAPSLMLCHFGTMGTPCANLGANIALTTTEPGAHHPALMWIAPHDGTYILNVTFLKQPGAPEVPVTLMLVHNDPSNILVSRALDDPDHSLDAEPVLAAGDIIVLSVITDSETSVNVGVAMAVTSSY